MVHLQDTPRTVKFTKRKQKSGFQGQKKEGKELLLTAQGVQYEKMNNFGIKMDHGECT